MTKNVVNLATCECDQGTAPTALMVTGGHTCIGGEVAATIRDVQFFGPFGTCKVTGSPCVYAPAAPWSQSLGSVSFNGSPPLAQGAKLSCVKSGIITVLDPGQSTVCTEARIAELDAERERLEQELEDTIRGILLDTLGVVDPTPISDLLGALNSLFSGDLPGVGLSLASMIPYLGDALAKPGKGVKAARAIKRITDALDNNRRLAEAAKAVDAAARSTMMEGIKYGKTLVEIDEVARIVDESEKIRKKRKRERP